MVSENKKMRRKNAKHLNIFNADHEATPAKKSTFERERISLPNEILRNVLSFLDRRFLEHSVKTTSRHMRATVVSMTAAPYLDAGTLRAFVFCSKLSFFTECEKEIPPGYENLEFCLVYTDYIVPNIRHSLNAPLPSYVRFRAFTVTAIWGSEEVPIVQEQQFTDEIVAYGRRIQSFWSFPGSFNWELRVNRFENISSKSVGAVRFCYRNLTKSGHNWLSFGTLSKTTKQFFNEKNHHVMPLRDEKGYEYSKLRIFSKESGHGGLEISTNNSHCMQRILAEFAPHCGFTVLTMTGFEKINIFNFSEIQHYTNRPLIIKSGEVGDEETFKKQHFHASDVVNWLTQSVPEPSHLEQTGMSSDVQLVGKAVKQRYLQLHSRVCLDAMELRTMLIREFECAVYPTTYCLEVHEKPNMTIEKKDRLLVTSFTNVNTSEMLRIFGDDQDNYYAITRHVLC